MKDKTQKVVIYTKVPCPYCQHAKSYFKNEGVAFEEHNLTNKWDEMDALKQRTGHMTFPQIFIGDKFIGGYDDLMAKVKSGEI